MKNIWEELNSLLHVSHLKPHDAHVQEELYRSVDTSRDVQSV